MTADTRPWWDAPTTHLSISDGCHRDWDIEAHTDGDRTYWTASRWSWPTTLDDFLEGDGDGGWAEFDTADEAIAQVRLFYGNP